VLRTTVQRTTASTGVELTVTHGLAQVPDYFFAVNVSARGVRDPHFPPASVLTNTVGVVNALQTTVTLNVSCVFWNGRLY